MPKKGSKADVTLVEAAGDFDRALTMAGSMTTPLEFFKDSENIEITGREDRGLEYDRVAGDLRKTWAKLFEALKTDA